MQRGGMTPNRNVFLCKHERSGMSNKHGLHCNFRIFGANSFDISVLLQLYSACIHLYYTGTQGKDILRTPRKCQELPGLVKIQRGCVKCLDQITIPPTKGPGGWKLGFHQKKCDFEDQPVPKSLRSGNTSKLRPRFPPFIWPIFLEVFSLAPIILNIPNKTG